MGLSLVLWGCASPAPETIEDCATLGNQQERENCRLEMLIPIFEGGNAEAFAKGLAQLKDPNARDLVRLRLAVQQPDRAGHLCGQVETQGAREKCRQVLGRPHLSAPRPKGASE